MSLTMAVLFAVSGASNAAPPPVAFPNRPTPAAAATALADEAAAKRGGRSEIAVLGTPHLSALPDKYDTRRFALLLDKLAAWQPRMIAVESVSGAQCDYLRTYAFAYPGTADSYCVDPEPARKALGLDGPKAEAEIETILAAPTANRSPDQRRRLVMLFLAVGDTTSALVQWLRLPPDERKADKRLSASFVTAMDKRIGAPNENYIIAAPLAARLGHDRVWLVADHTGDRASGPLTGEAEEAYGKDIMSLWTNPWSKARKTHYDAWTARIQAGTDGARGVVDWYRHTNSASEARFTVAGDFAAAASDGGPRGSGRKYLAYWETRNLRMVANIREAIGPYPGTRMLAIVGSSHKPYYERYLGVTSDVVMADVDTILR